MVNRGETVHKRKGWKVFRWILAIVSIIVFLIIGVGAGVTLYVINGLQPVNPQEREVRITIEPGSSSSQIAKLLEEKGVIRNQTVFNYYSRYMNQGSRFQAGIYDFEIGLSHEEIIEKLNNGEVVEAEMIRFTIPEGFNVRQIQQLLAQKGFVNEERFMELVQQGEFMQDQVQSIPDNEQILYRLEGYLFPETYEMKKDSKEEDIINRMLTELERKLNSLPKDWPEALESIGLTFHEMLTVASMIEREVVVPKERPIVSGIIQNRLAAGMKLELDATVQYLFEEQKEVVTYADLEIDSPYNTYENVGLPPGPVASPSLDAIRAALYPEESEFYFYVTKKDGTSEHYFGKTYNDHMDNINKSKMNEQNQ